MMGSYPLRICRVVGVGLLASLIVTVSITARTPPTDLLIQSTTDVQGYISPCG